MSLHKVALNQDGSREFEAVEEGETVQAGVFWQRLGDLTVDIDCAMRVTGPSGLGDCCSLGRDANHFFPRRKR